MSFWLLFSIGIYMAAMLFIGWLAYRKTSNLTDYMLGGRGLGPAVTALSAGASDMSSWLLMGMPGAMYISGISSAWIVFGLTFGAWANWLYVAPRLRVYTEVANDSITIPGYLENRFDDRKKVLRLVSGIVILVFFTFYVSSGMVSGGVLFNTTFGLDYHAGLILVTVIVVAYTLFGGFLAVSWTDFVQGIIMVVALLLVPIVTLIEIGGLGTAVSEVRSIDPKMLDIFEGQSVLGIVSLIAWGLGYFGQPHIIVRFMAITSRKDVKAARRIGMSWMIFSIIGAMFTGFLGIAYYSMNGLMIGDPETIFIKLGEILFHPIITGFILSAILAAVMSTISSQLLVTSSSLVEDLYKTFVRRNASDKELVFLGRAAVLIVSVIALALGWEKSDTILGLVSYAWAGFGAAFGPLILLSLYWRRMTKWGALAGMLVGAVTVIIWSKVPALTDFLYELLPGFVFSLLAVVIVSLLTKTEGKTEERFDEFTAKMKE